MTAKLTREPEEPKCDGIEFDDFLEEKQQDVANTIIFAKEERGLVELGQRITNPCYRIDDSIERGFQDIGPLEKQKNWSP